MLATLCPEWNKTCLPHEKKLTVPSEECCPQYQCKCDKCLLPNGSAVEVRRPSIKSLFVRSNAIQWGDGKIVFGKTNFGIVQLAFLEFFNDEN